MIVNALGPDEEMIVGLERKRCEVQPTPGIPTISSLGDAEELERRLEDLLRGELREDV